MKNISKCLVALVGLVVFAGCQNGTMSHVQVSSDEEFMEMMIPHHQEAIDNAEIVLEKSKNEELLELAQNIVDSQSGEIQQMQEWGDSWFGEAFEAATEHYENMMADISELEGDELDQAFISGMIAHHEGAVEMAEKIKEITERPELLELADDIIKAQMVEITLLKSWKK